MALHWSIEKVRDHQELTADEQERIITEGCCRASLVYGIGRITADNIDEWIFRQEFVLLTENWAPIAGRPEGVEPKPGPIPPMRLSRAQYERRIRFETNSRIAYARDGCNCACRSSSRTQTRTSGAPVSDTEPPPAVRRRSFPPACIPQAGDNR